MKAAGGELAAFIMGANSFRNDGFGWVCVRCDKELKSEPGDDRLPRFIREGEAESRSPMLANPALARWADPARTTLACPRCGTTERISETRP